MSVPMSVPRALAVAFFLFLGRSFAVLPARRRVVVGGPYRLVRHPAYAGELIMLVACVVAGPRWLTALLLSAAIPLVAIRILAEERLLRHDEAYDAYAERVKSRLIPFLW